MPENSTRAERRLLADLPDLLPQEPGHDVGTCALFPLAPDVRGCAEFDPGQDCYRYLLERLWDAARLTALVVMMNPSGANSLLDDRTVQGITRKVRLWDWRGVPHAFGRLLVGNTFAYRHKDQRALLGVDDPIGPGNDAALLRMAAEAALVVFAYGTPHARLRQRGPAVARMLMAQGVVPHVLRLSGQGVPCHPLYLPDDLAPMPWQPSATAEAASP